MCVCLIVCVFLIVCVCVYVCVCLGQFELFCQEDGTKGSNQTLMKRHPQDPPAPPWHPVDGRP